jgi:hypothetical protein
LEAIHEKLRSALEADGVIVPVRCAIAGYKEGEETEERKWIAAGLGATGTEKGCETRDPCIALHGIPH